MNTLNNIGMILSDTARSRSYLYHLFKNNIKPSFIFYLKNNSKNNLSGQINTNNFNKIIKTNRISKIKSEFYNPNNKIEEIIKKMSIEYEEIPYHVLNKSHFKEKIKKRQENIFIYSGYGSYILSESLIRINKIFIHSHGGYIPNYRGSTANYYSLLNDETIGASLLQLDKNIDTGPVICRVKKKLVSNRESIDYYHDCEIRSQALIKSLKYYIKNKKLPKYKQFKEGYTYYIIHPTLKYISILSNIK